MRPYVPRPRDGALPEVRLFPPASRVPLLLCRTKQDQPRRTRRHVQATAIHGVGVAPNWAKAPEVAQRRAPETSGDGFPVKRRRLAPTLPTGPRCSAG